MARASTPRDARNSKSALSSMASTLKAYSIPLTLFIASLFFQLIVTPHFFPTSHYDVLGIKRYSSVEEVTEAYKKISSKWNSDPAIPPTIDTIKVQYAFELLTNHLWKRDYDIFNIDEQFIVIEEAKNRYIEGQSSGIDLPLTESISFDSGDHAFGVINSENFLSKLEDDKALLVQIFSLGSSRCAKFSRNWKRIVNLLDGVVNSGTVELGDVRLVSYLAEKKPSGQPFFRNGVPALVAFPPGCKSQRCMIRYEGELSVDAVTDWVATAILSLPRIPYYTKESLVPTFLAKSKPHTVKAIFFSSTGERAAPFIRQAARNYWTYYKFAFVLWHERESAIWWNMFGVESAPAIVFLKEKGVDPVVYHGSINSSFLTDMMEKNKHHVLPQLRSLTSMELGCDARGFSRAGNDTKTWYCVILAGRHSEELSAMRETMRRVQEMLSNDGDLDAIDQDPSSLPAAFALKRKRLTFTWLDGEAQKKYCFFYVNSENSYETCGSRRDMTDVPRLFIVRYERNASDEEISTEKKPQSLLLSLNDIAPDPASQLVAMYNASSEFSEIIRWISDIIRDGDSRDLPSFRTRTPELLPEDGDNTWSTGSEQFFSVSKRMKQSINGLIIQIGDRLGDPMIGPILLLGALLSFGHIWFRRSQQTHENRSNHSSQSKPDLLSKSESNRANQPNSEDRARLKRRNRPRNQLIPPSITDVEPKDAYQMEFSDDDSE